VIYRNSLIIKAISITFFIVLTLAIFFTIIVFYFSPELMENLSLFTNSILDYGSIPSPFTWDLLFFIFLNNSGHFWNPIRMLVWIPVLGPILLAFEIILNSGLIGVVVVISGIDKGIAYPIVGVVPHGIIELPAFLLQLSSIVLWQVTITKIILSKFRGRIMEKDRIMQGLIDVLILAVTAIILLFVAALIETYVTPFFLGF
jgi:stage II sporulation protein M